MVVKMICEDVRFRQLKKEDLPTVREFIVEGMSSLHIRKMIKFSFLSAKTQVFLLAVTFLLSRFGAPGIAQLLIMYCVVFIAKVTYDAYEYKQSILEETSALGDWDKFNSTGVVWFCVVEIRSSAADCWHVVGSCSLQEPSKLFDSIILPVHGSTVELARLSVKTDQRGKGIGKNLLEQTIKYAKENKYDTIVLNASLLRESAIVLYKKVGFKVKVAEDVDNFRGQELFFTKPLTY